MSPDKLEWSQINPIQMAVQTADLFFLNNSQSEKISLSCTLLTIARGKCNVEIQSITENADTQPKEIKEKEFIGKIIIPRDRPVMKCEGFLLPYAFRTLYERFLTIQFIGRPILLTIFLDEKLSVSLNGDLFIEDSQEITIDHLDFVFPLR